MTIYKLPELVRVDALPAGAAVALGNFDGVHRGHQKLFELAKSAGCTASVAWTFTSLAKPGGAVPFLTDIKTKLALFCACGLDYAVLEDFSAVQSIPAADFARSYLAEGLQVGCVVCGFNFRFGKGGMGDAPALQSYLAESKIPVLIQQPVLRRSHIVSSSAIRTCVIEGDMDGAYDLLGRPFSIKFPVVRGKQLGRTIGIPTINQSFPEGHIIPRRGIYACTCAVAEDLFLGVANIGVRPTVTNGAVAVNCETHIIDYNGFLYGKEIQVDFYHRLRDEQKFSSVEELRAQVERDIQSTLDYFGKMYGG